MPAACPLRRPSDYEGPSSHQWLSEDEGHQGPKTVRWRSDHEKLSDFRGAVVMSARPRAQAPPLSPSVARAEVSNDPEDAENLPVQLRRSWIQRGASQLNPELLPIKVQLLHEL